jgi:tRNA A-37 threonylcarbamoyl transferase component Bud32
MRVRHPKKKDGRAQVIVNPRYRGLLERAGLRSVEDFFRLSAVIIGGHRHRHVARVGIHDGEQTFNAFLKREWNIPWKVYLNNACAGFGWVSRSRREALTLRQLQRYGVPCPQWMAVGEDGSGRAFLLVRELAGARELRSFLRECPATEVSERRAFARRLGETLAALHAAGFDHADLYAKHVLVGPAASAIHFLDWQRARHWRRLPWRRRLNDLAALDATVADESASPGERLRCLRSYLRSAASEPRSRPQPLRDVSARICRRARRLLRKPSVREVRRAAIPIGLQNLVWLDGESVCLTQEFLDALGGQPPPWLMSTDGPGNGVVKERVIVPGGAEAVLVRRWSCHPWRWLWPWLHRRLAASPEVRQAAVLYRLQRAGLIAPRLLAVGQRQLRPWRTTSFILSQPPADSLTLSGWLTHFRSRLRSYRDVLREAGAVLRRLHEAGCHFDPSLTRSADVVTAAFAVQRNETGVTAVNLFDVASLAARRRVSTRTARRDLFLWGTALARLDCRRADVLRFCLGYLGQRRLRKAHKRLVGTILFGACSPLPERAIQ